MTAALALLIGPAIARADDTSGAPGAGTPAPERDDDDAAADASAPARVDPPDQAIVATLGAAAGGRSTPGGLRVGGRWLYRITEDDWFESVASFTFGRGDARCFRDRDDSFLCEHGVADGIAAELAGAVRRRVLGGGDYQPFLRVGAAVRIVRFGDDDVSGLAIPLTAGGGVRVAISDHLAIGAEADLEFGLAWMGHGLGTEPQLGLVVNGLVEFAL